MEPEPREISSMATQCARYPIPASPYSSAAAIPSTPISPSFGHRSRGKVLLRSISSARGAISALEKRATVSRSASTSSPSAKSNPRQTFGIIGCLLHSTLAPHPAMRLPIRYRMFDIRTRMASSERMTRTPRPKPKEKTARLDSETWIAAAFDALAEGGIDMVRVEPLAKALDISKGSFYWHFADRRALIDAMLAAWAEGRIAAIRQQAPKRGAPAAVLRELADLYTHRANLRGLAIELAIRSLTRTDEAAARAV